VEARGETLRKESLFHKGVKEASTEKIAPAPSDVPTTKEKGKKGGRREKVSMFRSVSESQRN